MAYAGSALVSNEAIATRHYYFVWPYTVPILVLTVFGGPASPWAGG